MLANINITNASSLTLGQHCILGTYCQNQPFFSPKLATTKKLDADETRLTWLTRLTQNSYIKTSFNTNDSQSCF